jgi:hypothetical protein
MREDMFKIIVERPRLGWRSAPRCRGRLSGEDDMPVKIGMRRHVAVTRVKTKALNENLNPLRRYLGQQLGRPWDKVYSEIATTLSPGHTVKAHVRQHLDDFVARRISVGRGGEWINGGDRHFGRQSGHWRQPYYVDPNDGLLKDSAKLWKKRGVDPNPWRRREAEADPDVRIVDAMREHRRIGGIWYAVAYDRKPDGADDWAFDLIKRTRVPAATRHAAAKRQLSRAELDGLGLANTFND